MIFMISSVSLKNTIFLSDNYLLVNLVTFNEFVIIKFEMKAKNLGRLELLGWLNELAETDYPKVEQCSDGIAYC